MKAVQHFDDKGLTELPALIDPHVHFRTPGAERKEDWKSGAIAAVRSGVTMVCDMPNNTPPCTTVARLREKKKIIEAQLRAVGIPLRYGLYLGADPDNLDQIAAAKNEAIAIKLYMGSTTGAEGVHAKSFYSELFSQAAAAEMVVVVHAEDEKILQREKKRYQGITDPAFHSKIRSPEAAIVAVTEAIEVAAKFGTSLYIAHMSTKEEVDLVRQAKKNGLPVYAEAVTHHLFLTTEDYGPWKTLVQANPPLRTPEDQEALWEAIADKTIDTIATDHAPHLLEEKKLPYGQAPSGIPGIETLLPLLLDAVSRKKLTLEQLIALTRTNVEKIFALPPNDDCVYVDLELQKYVCDAELKTKCGWSPYSGQLLTGWPRYTKLRGQLYAVFIPQNIEEKPEDPLAHA
ncbi:MAG: Dihydroorotase [Chlamydiae bacterium]|nr:Dihydroorotase [Chlamydiota bacterium]